MGGFFSPRCCTVWEEDGRNVVLQWIHNGKQSFVLAERIAALHDAHLAASLMEKTPRFTSRERRALVLSDARSPDRMNLHTRAFRTSIPSPYKAAMDSGEIPYLEAFHNFCG